MKIAVVVPARRNPPSGGPAASPPTSPLILGAPLPDGVRCGAKTRGGGTCKSWPLDGQRRCRMHGGASPQAQAAAARRKAETAAEATIRRLVHNGEAVPVVDPVTELQVVAGVLRDAFAAAGIRVNELTRVGVETPAGGEQLRAEVVLWEKLIGHLRSVLADMVRLGIEERTVRANEAVGLAFADGVRWLLAATAARLALDATAVAVLDELAGVMVRALDSATPLPPVPAVAARELARSGDRPAPPTRRKR